MIPSGIWPRKKVAGDEKITAEPLAAIGKSDVTGSAAIPMQHAAQALHFIFDCLSNGVLESLCAVWEDVISISACASMLP